MIKKSKTPSRVAAPADVLKTLTELPHPVRLDELMRVLDLPRREKKNVLAQLEDLAAAGSIVHLRGGRWAHAAQMRTLRGTLAVQKSGVGFVTPERGGAQGDIFIPAHEFGGAWHGDVVELALVPGATRQRGSLRPEGKILRVLERGMTELSVMVTRRLTARGAICRPVDPRLTVVFDVDTASLDHRPEPGALLRVKVDARDGDVWRATALASLGREDDAAVQERLVKINHQVPMEFPEGVVREAEALREDWARHATARAALTDRQDLRHIDFVTIDGADARDFDDAIHVAKDGHGWVLHVAIADVSWFVRPGSGLDREARDRGNSCYFPLSVEPMLPEALSADLCSLRPDEDRFVMVARLPLSAQGEPGQGTFMPGVIRSRARLTYTQVQAVLDGAAAPDTPPPAICAMLEQAAALARVLRTARMRRGALDMDLPEAAYTVDENGRVTSIHKAQSLFSHKLIEECMLAANEAVARYLTARGVPFPCRIHPEPDPERLENLFHALKGASLPPALLRHVPAKPEAAAVKSLLDAARDTPQAFLVNRMTLRAMMQARYAPEVAGHFGLASECYCHFTSPIRRYADLVVHRALRHTLGVGVGPVPAGIKLLAVTEHCNTRERAAQDAEREITRRMACLLLRGREGEVFEALIAATTDFGFFVELADMPVEALVPLATLQDDWYAYDPQRQELLGAGTGRAFRIGQAIRVRLMRVDLGRLEIDCELADPAPAGRGRARPGPRTAQRARAAAPAGRTRRANTPETAHAQKRQGADRGAVHKRRTGRG